MSLRANHVAHHAASNIGFPATGGTKKKSSTKKSGKSKGAGKSKAKGDEPGLQDGVRGNRNSGQSGPNRKLVRRRVRRHRTGKATSSYGTTPAQQAKQTKQAKQTAKAQQNQQPGQAGSTQNHMTRKWNGMGNLNRAAHLFKGSQAGKPQGPQTPAGQKFVMLNNLGKAIGLDHALGKVNPNDKSFAYRLPESRTLVATINMMGSSNSFGKKKDTKKSEGKKEMSPAAFARGKQTIRRIASMFSDAVVPDDLPADYQRQSGYA